MDVNAIAGLGLQNDVRQMESISQNLANAVTPGYKKQLAMGTTFQAQLSQAALAQPLPLTLPSLQSSVIDAGAGRLRATGDAHDVAVDGTDFLELATPDGAAYTRQGKLRVDVDGRLVGDQGHPVVSSAGPLTLSNAPFTIDGNGDVQQDGRVVGRLKRVRFEQAARLQPLGGAMYALGGATVADPNSSAPVKLGFQEASNVDTTTEMVRMSMTVRHFEALARVVQGYDDNLEKTIRKLGDF
ncbi:flagellar hook-basal body protein [Pseudoduganella sp. S-14]|uniref:flagellar hook-basal body protein n=1 Tax=Pseudoduganella sp. S-14 TaxID=3404065 RepID=UPI003CF13036